MLSNRKDSKLQYLRPYTPTRRYDTENSSIDYSEFKSKIPRMPKRTLSYEGKVTTEKLGTGKKTSAISMIPRLGLKSNSAIKKLNNKENNQENTKRPVSVRETGKQLQSIVSSYPSKEQSVSSLEDKVKEDFNAFKNGVLKIPEYWTDAGETVTNILRNAVQIITKQYPSADMHLFEQDIQKILRETETVKKQILVRIENIMNKADNLYNKNIHDTTEADEHELKNITKRMESLKNEVTIRKNVFVDLLKYGSEMKELLEIENIIKQKALKKESINDDFESNRFDELKKNSLEKVRNKFKNFTESNKKNVKSIIQSCGDSEGQKAKKLETDRKSTAEDKTTQTEDSWRRELTLREKDLKELTEHIMEVHKLCKDYILKFKNINFQIKMKGYSGKSRGEVIYKDIHTLKDDDGNTEKTDNLFLNKNDITDKNLDVYNKTKLLHQQKKLMQVRNELLGMLKSRYHLKEGIRS